MVFRTVDPQDLETLILTVPVDSFEAYRQWLTSTSQQWSAIERIKIIDEPTAAALGYGIDTAQNLLVIDFGGGTVDFSVVKFEGKEQSQGAGWLKWGQRSVNQGSSNRVRVWGKAGKNLGGCDLDYWLLEHFQLPASSLTLRLAERVKIALTTQENAEEVFFDDRSFNSYELKLDRATFEQILTTQGFFSELDRLWQSLKQQLQRQNLAIEDLSHVVLVGGTTQIPAFQRWVKQKLPQATIKLEQPFTAIATGALQLSQQLEIQDFLYHSYGIRYWDRKNNAHGWHTLIPEGQAYPMAEPVELFLGASTPNQTNIELILGELNTTAGATEVYFDGDRLVTLNLSPNTINAQTLNENAPTIAALKPPGNPGSDRLRLEFRVDRDRFLRLTVEDLFTMETLMDNQVVIQLS
jgi:molecular chaperone DnaK (HSP70)